MGIQDNLKICGSARVSRSRSSANKIQPNLFCGCLFGPGCFGVLLEALRIYFLGFDFCPHSIIPVALNPEYLPPPLGYRHNIYCMFSTPVRASSRAFGIARECTACDKNWLSSLFIPTRDLRHAAIICVSCESKLQLEM